ncbi:MAG: hypothetical protein IJ247_05270 [Bacilli bacterium]|nr:hypothetical protein [Bacilli bacterium]
MKKTVITFISLISLLSLSGCSFFEQAGSKADEIVSNVVDPEKSYTYNNFATMVAERNLQDPPYTVGTLNLTVQKGNSEAEEEETNYTFENKAWVTDDPVNSLELKILNTGYLITQLQSIKTSKTTGAYKYRASTKTYRLIYETKDKDNDYTIEGEYKYDQYGILVEGYLKLINTVDFLTTTYTFTMNLK